MRQITLRYSDVSSRSSHERADSLVVRRTGEQCCSQIAGPEISGGSSTGGHTEPQGNIVHVKDKLNGGTYP